MDIRELILQMTGIEIPNEIGNLTIPVTPAVNEALDRQVIVRLNRQLNGEEIPIDDISFDGVNGKVVIEVD